MQKTLYYNPDWMPNNEVASRMMVELTKEQKESLKKPGDLIPYLRERYLQLAKEAIDHGERLDWEIENRLRLNPGDGPRNNSPEEVVDNLFSLDPMSGAISQFRNQNWTEDDRQPPLSQKDAKQLFDETSLTGILENLM